MIATGFTGSPLDRVDHSRNDPAAYQALLGDWRVLRLDGVDPVIASEGGLLWQSMADVAHDAELMLAMAAARKRCASGDGKTQERKLRSPRGSSIGWPTR